MNLLLNGHVQPNIVYSFVFGKVPNSILGPETRYFDLGHLCFSQPLQASAVILP